MEKRREDYLLNPRLCRACSVVFPYGTNKGRLYCSRDCANSFTGEQRVIPRPCPVCSEQMADRNAVHCSTKCFTEAARLERIRRFHLGELPAPRIRAVLIDVRGHKCEECGLSDWRGQPIPVESHHKDGDASNNMPDNVQLICKNCHGLTPNFGNKNKGKGRESRRKFYALNGYS